MGKHSAAATAVSGGAVLLRQDAPRSAPLAMPLPAARYPGLRYMGSKKRLLPWIYQVLDGLDFETGLDPFTGTACVAYLIKAMGRRVVASDFLNFSSIIGRATVENSRHHLDDKTIEALLSKSSNCDDFIERTFGGVFFTREDLRFLDRLSRNIRQLENPYDQALAYSALFRSCLKRQPRGVFTVSGNGSRYDDGRRDLKLSLEEHFLEQVQVFNASVFDNGHKNRALHSDIFELPRQKVDLVYLDPPYVPRADDNCYIKRYHFLEGLATYWRGQEIMWETRTRKLVKRHRKVHGDRRRHPDSRIAGDPDLAAVAAIVRLEHGVGDLSQPRRPPSSDASESCERQQVLTIARRKCRRHRRTPRP